MNNSILIFMDGAKAKHRFCPEAEGQEFLRKVMEEGGNASLMTMNVDDAELCYVISPDLRERVASAKTRLQASYRIKAALDHEGVPSDLNLRKLIHQAFDNLSAGVGL